MLFEKLHKIGVPTISLPDVEADDVLATAFFKWDVSKRGPVTLLSTDKDLANLVGNGARVPDHFNLVWRDEEWIVKKFGVPASLLHDLLALMGDSSDDVPRVPDCGPKTGAKWLTPYGSFDEVLLHAADITGKVGVNLRNNIELVKLARQLVAFKTDIPLGLTWTSLRYQTGELDE